MVSFVFVLVSIGLGLFATVWSGLGFMSFTMDMKWMGNNRLSGYDSIVFMI